MLEEGDRCQQCGTKDSEWAENRFAYVAEGHMCQGCYHLEAESENLRGEDGKTMPGTTVRLVANTPQKQAEMAARSMRNRDLQE